MRTRVLAADLLTWYLRHASRRATRFDTIDHVDAPRPLPGRHYLLYAHIPFCESLCPFCPFHRRRFDPPLARQYFHALNREIRRYHDLGYAFTEAYVGGGTPTVLPEELCTTLQLIRALFPVKRISCETNPSHLREEVLAPLRHAGVNRLSVGVQSLDDELLKAMGRFEPYGSGAEIVERLHATQGRFDTLNVDMIFNLPHQTRASLAHDIHTLTRVVGVDQISFYPLMSSGAAREPARAPGEAQLYETILASVGEEYRLVSAWCVSRRQESIDEYIVEHDEYVGTGSGAFSHLDGVMYSTTFSVPEYIERVTAGRTALVARKCLTHRERMQYDLLMRLFGLALPKRLMQQKYGPRYARQLWKELLALRLLGAIEDDGQHYRLTRRGLYYGVVIMREFFNSVNHFRAQMRERAMPDPRDARPPSPGASGVPAGS